MRFKITNSAAGVMVHWVKPRLGTAACCIRVPVGVPAALLPSHLERPWMIDHSSAWAAATQIGGLHRVPGS